MGKYWNTGLMSAYLVLAFAALLIVCHAQEEEPVDPVVNAGPLGDIRGVAGLTFINYKPRFEFLGIPYAKAPNEQDRFLPPEPINGPLLPDGETFNATYDNGKDGIQCIQPGLFPGTATGTEDCLILNVITPKLPDDDGENLPVIVFVHGGAFLSGSSTAYRPDRLIETEEVVVVTINYRLGILGFFCLEDQKTPGNAALYDVLAAMRWVKSYISYFGGDPNSITATGQSAGAVLISYMMASPLAQGPDPLFHRAITLSGSALNPWAVNESPKKASLTIAKMVECSDTDDESLADIDAIVACMKTVETTKMVTALTTYQNDERFAGRLGTDVLAPAIQSWAMPEGLSPFISRHPRLIFEEGSQMNISLLSSSTKHDGSFPLGILYNRYLNCAECMDRVNDEFFLRKQLVPTLLRAMGIHDDTDLVYDALADKYLKEAKNSGNYSHMVYGLVDLHSVFFFKAGIYQTVELHSRLNPNTYFSSFEYAGEHTIFPLYFFGFPYPDVPGGIAHGDDLIYLLLQVDPVLNEEETEMSNRMVSHWVNFAKSSNPNSPFGFDVVWPPLTQLSPRYLQFVHPMPLVQEEYPETFDSAADDLRPPPQDDPTTTTTTEEPITTTPTTTTTEEPITTPTTTTTEEPITTTPTTTTTEEPITTTPTTTTTEEPITTTRTTTTTEEPITTTPTTTTTEEEPTTTDSSAPMFGSHWNGFSALVICTLLCYSNYYCRIPLV